MDVLRIFVDFFDVEVGMTLWLGIELTPTIEFSKIVLAVDCVGITLKVGGAETFDCVDLTLNVGDTGLTLNVGDAVTFDCVGLTFTFKELDDAMDKCQNVRIVESKDDFVAFKFEVCKNSFRCEVVYVIDIEINVVEGGVTISK